MIPVVALADPIDRLLVHRHANTSCRATRDRRLLDYAARTGAVRVIDASR